MNSFDPRIKKILEKVMNTYNDNLKKSFGHPNWWSQSPLLLSKVDKATAQELLPLIKVLPNHDKEVEWNGFSEHFPLGVYVLSRKVKEGEIKDLMTIKGMLNDGSRFLNKFSLVIKELEEIERENNKKDDKQNPPPPTLTKTKLFGCECVGHVKDLEFEIDLKGKNYDENKDLLVCPQCLNLDKYKNFSKRYLGFGKEIGKDGHGIAVSVVYGVKEKDKKQPVKKCLRCEEELNKAKKKVEEEPGKYQLIPQNDYERVCASHSGIGQFNPASLKQCSFSGCKETIEERNGFLIKKTPCKLHANHSPNPPSPNNNSQSNSENNEVQLLDKLEQYFIRNNIKLIKRVNGNLVIEFSEENSANNQSLSTEQEQQLNNYLTRTNRQSLTLKEIERERERERERESKNGSWTPWIIGGIGIVAVLGVITVLVTRKRKK